MKLPTPNNNINAIKEVRQLSNKLRNSLYREKTNRIREKLYKKETVCIFLNEKEQEGSLTNKQKNVLNNIVRYLKKLKKDLEKLQKHQYNITYGLDYLFNELNEEDYYEPTESRVLLMVVICYMKAEEIKMLNYR